jgi:regulatory protein
MLPIFKTALKYQTTPIILIPCAQELMILAKNSNAIAFLLFKYICCMMKKTVSLDEKEILAKILKYCAYRERTMQEVKQKLYEYQASEEVKEKIITFLKEENYVNDERYTQSYVRGKVNIKKWGKQKIKSELRNKNIKGEEVDNALNDIDEASYKKTLMELLIKKNNSLKDEIKNDRRNKLVRYGLSKGYEMNLIFECLKEII